MIYFSVHEDYVIKKLAVYVMLRINADEKKEVIFLQIGENENSKYWLGVLNELKNHGMEDIMVICADGKKYTSICKLQGYEIVC